MSIRDEHLTTFLRTALAMPNELLTDNLSAGMMNSRRKPPGEY